MQKMVFCPYSIPKIDDENDPFHSHGKGYMGRRKIYAFNAAGITRADWFCQTILQFVEPR